MGKDAVVIRKEFHDRLGQVARELAKQLYPAGMPRGTSESIGLHVTIQCYFG